MEVSYRKPMDYGMGLDSLTMEPKNVRAVTSDNLKEVRGTGNTQTVEFALLNTRTMEQYEAAFCMEANAAATYGFFGGSAAFQFAQKHTFHSYSHYLVTYVKVTNNFKQIEIPLLNPATRGNELLMAGKKDEFQRQFGDCYVQGITEGGVLFGIIEFTTKTQEDLVALSASLDASYFGVWSASANFSSSMAHFKGSTSLKVVTFQQGGTDYSLQIDFDAFLAKALNFPNEVKNAAEPYSVVLMDYKTLDLPDGPNSVDFDNAKLILARFYKLRAQIIQTLNDIEYIKANPSQFENGDKLSFKEEETHLTNALNTLTERASKCVKNVSECKFDPLILPVINLPLRKGQKELETTLAAKGANLAKNDMLASELRSNEPTGSGQRGFDIGMGISEGHTLLGPGKDKFCMTLPADEQPSYRRGVQLSVDRNRNIGFYGQGLAVLNNDASAKEARGRLPTGLSWVGFQIAAGIFGSSVVGGAGHTQTGPGSTGIRNALGPELQQGFDAAVAYFTTAK